MAGYALNPATVLVWHASKCTKCRRYAKCPEYYEIIREFA